MPQLGKTYKGWQKERLAAYILSHFSFISRPETVGDDNGLDFLCTIFESRKSSKKADCLFPTTSFAIQIKSTAKNFVTKNLEYLSLLETPYFIGVTNRNLSALDIYSAELLQVFFALEGEKIKKLSLSPTPSFKPAGENYYTDKGNGHYVVLCPLVERFTAEEDPERLKTKVEKLRTTCERAQTNIINRKNNQHIYDLDDSGNNFRLLAGPGSANHFRINLLRRLAEAFYNLEWLLKSPQKGVDRVGIPKLFYFDEFNALEELYLKLKMTFNINEPNPVSERYYAAKKWVKEPSQ